MRTTVDLPDELLRRTKALAALRGVTLKQLLTAALIAYLENGDDPEPAPTGWRSVLGKATREEVAEIDAIIRDELGRVDPGDWK